MPHLMINLDDPADCRRGKQILQQRIADSELPGASHQRDAGGPAAVASLPLPQKLKRIQSRAMWKHLVRIAQSAEEPLSLPELDRLLDLPKNKMRSLKAIMAKLENRFEIEFLKVDPDGGLDDAGNPRYLMPAKVRRQIRRLSQQSAE